MSKFRRVCTIASLLVAAALLVACGPSAGAPEPVVVEQAAVEKDFGASAEMPPGLSGPSAPVTERLIIRNGQLTLVVEDTRTAQQAVEAMVAEMAGEGAFVVSASEFGATGGKQPQVNMSIRVPAARFDEAMDRLSGLATEVTNRNESAEDVTEEYVDLEARLESLEAARQRLLEIMNEARTTEDLLQAEQQLTQREAEIESIKGRMQYLSESAKLASIWVELQPSVLSQPVSGEWRPGETIRTAVEALLAGLRAFANIAIFFAIAILPWLLAMGLVLFLIARLVRSRSRARRKGADEQTPGAGA
jgi:hypothetical protein